MFELDRRLFLSLLGVSLVELASANSPQKVSSQRPVPAWLPDIEAASQELRSGSLTQVEWQSAIEKTLGSLDLVSVLNELDFDRVIAGFDYPNLGVTTKRLRNLEKAFPGKIFIAKIFGVQRDRAIIPHGHSNIASAHLVLNGEFSLRQFDKISETDKHMIIRQTVEELAPAGSVSSISDDKNNVHWFIATSAHAYTLDFIILDLSDKPYQIHNLDPLAGILISPGELRVPKIGVESALQKYGKSTWGPLPNKALHPTAYSGG